MDEQCIRNNDGVMAVIDEDKKLSWKNYHERPLNTKINGIVMVYFKQKEFLF